MAHTGADLFVDAIDSYGVSRVFGNPGTTELPIMHALADSSLEYVLALHEDVAVGMAAGYAKTRHLHSFDDPSITPLGVVNLHVAPGVAHGIGNLFDSSLIGTGAPLLVTAGAHATDHQHREPNLHGDLVRMTRPYTKWSAEATRISTLPTLLRRAARVALTPPTGPVFLSLPLDVMMEATDQAPERLGEIPTAGDGDARNIAEATDLIETADEPVLVLGDLAARGGPPATEAAARLADATGVRVHSELKASEIPFPPDHPAWFGRLPRDQDATAAYLDTDLVVFAGVVSNTTTNPQTTDLLTDGTTVVHISNHPWEIGKNHPADLGIIGDPGRVMARLADRLTDRIQVETLAARRDRIESRRPDEPNEPSNPAPGSTRASKEHLAAAVHAAAPTARVVAEAPTTAGAFRARYDFEPGQYLGNRGGGLGYGLPAAIGTALAESERDTPRDVIGLIGDGSYLYYPHAIYTAARYNIDVTIVVPDNRNYRILKDNTLAIFGGEETDYEFIGMDFEPPVDIPANAESHGATGRLIDNPSDIHAAVEKAIAEPGPTVLDVLTHD